MDNCVDVVDKITLILFDKVDKSTHFLVTI